MHPAPPYLPNSLRARPRGAERGFTLLELLVVLAILGLLIGFVGPAVIRQLGSAKSKIAKQEIVRLSGVLDLYRLDIGSYPTTEQGLKALVEQPAGLANWNGPYIKGDKVPVDPWDRPFVYRRPSTRQGHDFDLCTLGADGQSGGSGEDVDFCNE
jgi:general secretion pathway protein G